MIKFDAALANVDAEHICQNMDQYSALDHNLAGAYLALRDWLVMMESDDHTPAYLRTVMRQALTGDSPNGR